MTRLLLLAAALAMLPITTSAQSFLPTGDDDNCMGCPPVLSSDLSNEADQVTEIGETMKEYSDDDPGYGFIWWLATNFSPHIPVDPKCPPPDGCTEDPEGPEGPEDPEGPGGGEETPPGGEGDPPAGGGDAPPTDGDDEEPQKSTAASSSGSSSSSSGGETFDLGDRSAALALRSQFESVPDGRFALRGTLENGSRLRLVSKRESSADEGEYVMRFEVIPSGPRARAVPVLVQAINGKLYARTAARATSIPGNRVRPDRPRVQRRGVRG